jgi:hypothetical protein
MFDKLSKNTTPRRHATFTSDAVVFCSARLQLEKLRQKMAREGQGVTHNTVEGSAAHRLMEKHVRTWGQFVAIDLAATSEPAPSILLVDVQFPGNVGAIVRNCGLCGFGRVLLLSTEEGGSRGSELYSKAFLKTALQKSLAHKYDWDFQLVVGRSLGFVSVFVDRLDFRCQSDSWLTLCCIVTSAMVDRNRYPVVEQALVTLPHSVLACPKQVMISD